MTDEERASRDLQYIGKSREELEKIVPNGSYIIGAPGFQALTGKGGYIQYILALTKEIQKN